MDVKGRGKLSTLKTNVAGLDGRKHHRNAKGICGEPRRQRHGRTINATLATKYVTLESFIAKLQSRYQGCTR